jgi:4-aminobutyrate aminotransferase-like enzyme
MSGKEKDGPRSNAGLFFVPAADDALRGDPRVQEARALIESAEADRQSRLTGPRPPDPDLKEAYDALIRRFEEERGGTLFYPYLGSGLGRGALVELADGSVKYDFISGIGVHALGHGHPVLREAHLDAAFSSTTMQGNLEQNADSAQLLHAMLAAANRTGASLAHGFLTSSGAMANENALKILLQKRSPARRFLAFEGAFAGRTLALVALNDNPATREGLPLVIDVDRVPYFNPDRSDESIEAAVSSLDAHLEQHPGAYAAMHMEMILGEGGSYAGSREFFEPLMEMLRDHGIAVWVDEIQTFGRTTELFAFQHFGLESLVDVVTVGKMTQVCATLFRDELRPRPGLISQTFTGATSAIHASHAILKVLAEGDLYGPGGRVDRLSRRFQEHLAEIGRRHPARLSGPFGYGAMVACTIGDGDLAATKTFLRALFDAGVIAFYSGSAGARVRFLMPVAVVTESEIDDVAAIIERVLVERSAP